jgi:class 3 adenylate cyclase
VFGRTVNLAARIADYARAGEVLVEEGVTLSGPGGGVEFDLVGPVGLKGVSVPVTVYAARAS